MRGATIRVAVAVATIALVGVACGSSRPLDSPSTSVAPRNPSDDGPLSGGALEGLRGVRPLVDVPEWFADDLSRGDTTATDWLVDAAAAYDAIVISAVAAVAAGSDSTLRLSDSIIEATRGRIRCATFAACSAAAEEGSRVAYQGLGAPRALAPSGRPLRANFETVRIDATDRPVRIGSSNERLPDPEAAAVDGELESIHQPNGTLEIGTLLPSDGPDGPSGRAQRHAVELAVRDINAAGGVLGRDVVLRDGDSGDGSPEAAGAAATRLLAMQTDVIVGSTDAVTTAQLIGPITGAGRILFSPTDATTPALSTPGRRLFFSLRPSASNEAGAIIDAVRTGGATALATLGRRNDRDRELMDDLGALAGLGGLTVIGQGAATSPFDVSAALVDLIGRLPDRAGTAIVISGDPATVATAVRTLRATAPDLVPRVIVADLSRAVAREFTR